MKFTFQKEFPETTICCRCNGESRIAFVAHERISENDIKGPFLYDLYPNRGDGDFWLHDCASFAIYLCRKCLEPTALYNQG